MQTLSSANENGNSPEFTENLSKPGPYYHIEESHGKNSLEDFRGLYNHLEDSYSINLQTDGRDIYEPEVSIIWREYGQTDNEDRPVGDIEVYIERECIPESYSEKLPNLVEDTLFSISSRIEEFLATDSSQHEHLEDRTWNEWVELKSYLE